MTVAHGGVPGDARRTALRVLIDTERRHGRELKPGLDAALSASDLTPQDLRLAAELVYGSVRWKRRLDRITNNLARRPDRISAEGRCLLRMGIYQLLLMDGIPPHAAVYETVELAAGTGVPRGFINAILRQVQRDGDPLRYPDRDEKPVQFLGARYSYPDWIVQRWVDRFGVDEAERLCVAHNEPAPMTLRTNLRRTTRPELVQALIAADVRAEPGRHTDTAVHAAHVPPLPDFEPFAEGLFTVQDESSQLVTQLLDPQPGEVVLDVCAAPGGKTTHVAERMDDRGRIVANDPSPDALDRLRENAQRLGLASIETRAHDGAEPIPELQNGADRVLVDAPCTSLGILRRHAEGRWLKRDEDARSLAAIQSGLLANAANHVRPGGVLVYGVCTDSHEETTDVIERFLAEHPAFTLEPAQDRLHSLPDNAYTEKGELTMAPHRHGTDGFYAVRVRRSP